MGGSGENVLATQPDVPILDLETQEFSKGPDLNQARARHSTTILGGSIYVVGGDGALGYLSTIEKLNIKEKWERWMTINLKGFTFRHRPLVCNLNRTDFVVAGGTDGYSGYFIDSIVIKT